MPRKTLHQHTLPSCWNPRTAMQAKHGLATSRKTLRPNKKIAFMRLRPVKFCSWHCTLANRTTQKHLGWDPAPKTSAFCTVERFSSLGSPQAQVSRGTQKISAHVCASSSQFRTRSWAGAFHLMKLTRHADSGVNMRLYSRMSVVGPHDGEADNYGDFTQDLALPHAYASTPRQQDGMFAGCRNQCPDLAPNGPAKLCNIKCPPPFRRKCLLKTYSNVSDLPGGGRKK